MSRRASGEVIERKRATGRTFAMRFRAYGRRHFVHLGGAAEGWTRARAEAELRHVLADVERGLWAPDVARAADVPNSPTFHEFASDWLEGRKPELRESSLLDYSWQLCNHLLPFFHRHLLPQITVAEVDRYRDFNVREGLLAAESINKTITRLGQILAVAEERDLIARNPVRVNTRRRTAVRCGRARRVLVRRAARMESLHPTGARRRTEEERRLAHRAGV